MTSFLFIAPIFLYYTGRKHRYFISLIGIAIYVFKIFLFSITHQVIINDGKTELLIKQQTENVSFLSQLAEPLRHGCSVTGLTFMQTLSQMPI